MATNKIQTGIRFEPDLLYKITVISKLNKRSLNGQLEFWHSSVFASTKKKTVRSPWIPPHLQNKEPKP